MVCLVGFSLQWSVLIFGNTAILYCIPSYLFNHLSCPGLQFVGVNKPLLGASENYRLLGPYIIQVEVQYRYSMVQYSTGTVLVRYSILY